MDFRKLLLKKWFWYTVIYVALSLILLYLLSLPLEIEELPANFLAEVFGLLFTLSIFMMLLDLRAILEWKSVEDRVKRRMGKQIHAVFIELSNLCKFDRVLTGDRLYDDEELKKVKEKLLNSLAYEDIILNDSTKELFAKKNLAFRLASYLDSKRVTLSEIEGKYLKFLDSELQTSLMDIQDYLHELNFALRFALREEYFYKSISKWIKRIMNEIVKIRDGKIDIGF